MKARYFWLLPVFVGMALGGWVKGSTMTHYFNDHDTLIPAFFTRDILGGLTGTIKLNIQFEKGKVVSVKVLSSKLSSSTDYAERYPGLVKLTVERIAGTIKDWDTSFVGHLSNDLTVELKIDPSLQANARDYRIEFGKLGLVSKLVMTGPALKEY